MDLEDLGGVEESFLTARSPFSKAVPSPCILTPGAPSDLRSVHSPLPGKGEALNLHRLSLLCPVVLTNPVPSILCLREEVISTDYPSHRVHLLC